MEKKLIQLMFDADEGLVTLATREKVKAKAEGTPITITMYRNDDRDEVIANQLISCEEWTKRVNAYVVGREYPVSKHYLDPTPGNMLSFPLQFYQISNKNKTSK